MRWRMLILVALAAHAGSYLVFRAVNQEVWADDGKTYAIFPADGLKALIGPHR